MVLGKNHPIFEFVMKCAKPSTHALIHKKKQEDESSKMGLIQVHKYEFKMI